MLMLNLSTGTVQTSNDTVLSLQPRVSASRRQSSLDREVFYFDNDRRKEIVTYKPFTIGSSVKKFGLKKEEEIVYMSSLKDLCNQLSRVSKSSKNIDNSFKSESRLSIEKVNNPCLHHLPGYSVVYILEGYRDSHIQHEQFCSHKNRLKALVLLRSYFGINLTPFVSYLPQKPDWGFPTIAITYYKGAIASKEFADKWWNFSHITSGTNLALMFFLSFVMSRCQSQFMPTFLQKMDSVVDLMCG